MARVHVIFTGGTMAGEASNRMAWKDYTAGSFTGEELLSQLPEASSIAQVSHEQLGNFASSSLDSSQWERLHRRVVETLENEDVDGVVITHGTNTLEESAYFLNLTVRSSKPIVLVGAQRPFTALSSDASHNLLNAIRVAANSSAQAKGVLTVLNDQIASAREVAKRNTYRLETFNCGQTGFLGFVDPDLTVHFYREPTRRHTRDSALATNELTGTLPRVAVLYSHVDSSPELIEAAVSVAHCAGIVVAGTGGGHVSAAEAEVLTRVARGGVPVVRASRTGEGRVVRLNRPSWDACVTADNLSPQKAAIVLRLALSAGIGGSELQRLYDTH